MFMLVLLRPMAGSLPGWRARLGVALPLALAVLGMGANALLGFGARDLAATGLRVLVASQLGWAVYGLLLVEQLFRNQAENTRWGASRCAWHWGSFSRLTSTCSLGR